MTASPFSCHDGSDSQQFYYSYFFADCCCSSSASLLLLVVAVVAMDPYYHGSDPSNKSRAGAYYIGSIAIRIGLPSR